jgi:tripartite-type tricarboxylate transporter receptor subunit TctC
VIGEGSYDERQLTPVFGVFGHDTIAVLAKKGSPYRNYASLKAATKPITAGVAGVKSSAAWAALAELAEVNGIHMTAVPFNGGAPATDAAMGGSIDLAATTLVEAVRLVNAGKAQAVLQFASGPLPDLPGVESIAQVGKPSEVLDTVLGLTGPPHMPQDKVQVLSAALTRVAHDPTFITRAKNVGLEVEAQPPAAWGQTIATSYQSIQQEAPLLLKFGSK